MRNVTRWLGFALAALLVVGAISALASTKDDGVPNGALNGVKSAVKGTGALAPHSVGHLQLKNKIVDCQKFVVDLQHKLCGPQKTTPGLAGPAGPAGAQGPAGPAGEQGPKGDTGATGPTGPAGCTPAPVELQKDSWNEHQDDPCRGERGYKGPKGDPGEAGPAGPQGDPGPAGPEGPRGYKGYKGDPGPQGEPGKDGKDGADGKDGLGNGTLVICLDGKGGINQAPCNGEQTPVTVVIVKNAD